MGQESAITPPAPADFDALTARLSGLSDTLPKRLLQCARFLLDNPDEVALGTTAAIARAAGVQPSTLVRFAQALGFSGFSEMQELLRANLLERGQSYSARLDRARSAAPEAEGPRQVLRAFADTAQSALAGLADGVDGPALEQLVAHLAAAETVHVLGLRRSYPVATYLLYAFGKLGKPCTLIDTFGGMLSDRASLIGPRDALLTITFHPYAPETAEFVEAAAAQGRTVLAITDSALSPVHDHAAAAVSVRDADFGGIRTLSATLCLASAIAVALGQALHDKTPSTDPDPKSKA